MLSGSETTLPTEEGERSISYEFSPSTSSDRRAETFRFDYTLEVEERLAEDTLVFLQATLAPGEEEECNGEPCVPRYRAQFIPSYQALPFPEFESYFPGSSSLGRLTRLKFTNPRDFELGVQLEALSPAGEPVSGPEIVNPASLTIAGEARSRGWWKHFRPRNPGGRNRNHRGPQPASRERQLLSFRGTIPPLPWMAGGPSRNCGSGFCSRTSSARAGSLLPGCTFSILA